MRLENLVYTNSTLARTRPATGKSTAGHNSAIRTKTVGRKKLNKSKEREMPFIGTESVETLRQSKREYRQQFLTDNCAAQELPNNSDLQIVPANSHQSEKKQNDAILTD